MQRFLYRHRLVLSALLSLASACNGSKDVSSTTKSDWLTSATPATTDLKTYAIDWACEPKRFGEIAETKIADQDEYCEWKVAKKTATEKQCVFTTSFDDSRAFYLNSRGATPVNSISAARQLVEDCNGIALTRLNQGKTAGTLCSNITSGCVAGRNSDPEICDKVRWVTGEKFNKTLDFCVDQLAQRDSIVTPRPLIQFGILTDLPENCVYSADDHTEVTCTVPLEDTCFSVAGQLRPGLRVIVKPRATASATTPTTSTPSTSTSTGFDPAIDELASTPTPAVVSTALPSTKECYVP